MKEIFYILTNDITPLCYRNSHFDINGRGKQEIEQITEVYRNVKKFILKVVYRKRISNC